MIIYEATKKEFINDVYEETLVNNIINNYKAKIGNINEREVRSWDNSMQYMYRVMQDEDIPDDSGVAIEFKIPYTSRRVDFLISGKDETHSNVVVIELKQWNTVEKVEKEGIVKTRFQHGIAETTHPSYQAWSYASLIEDYNQTVQNENINIIPSAYLHNYISNTELGDPLLDKSYSFYVEKAPIFTKGQSAKLREFIKKYIKYGDNKEGIYKIENGKIRPSKSLQDTLLSMLHGNEEFIMIDEQKVIYETALQLAEKALRTNTRQTLIVKGGPGTGKSVLAINLLVELTRRSMVAQYVTKNSAPRNVYSIKLKKDFRKNHIDNLFKSSGSYINTPEKEFDALIVDESHRLNAKSGLYSNQGENQIKEIIHSSKFSLFFIDEHQKVTLKDVGSIEEIKKYTDSLESKVTEMELQSQFRCNGSDGYLAWLDDLLGIRETANKDGFEGFDYKIKVFDNPQKLYESIQLLNKRNNKARLMAGYCWEWKKDGKDKTDVKDIEIPEFNFAMSWNLNSKEPWAIGTNSVHEVGCVHTSQGLEFDYVGVIIGNDLRMQNGKIITDYTKRAKTDQSLKGIRKGIKENKKHYEKIADEIIRNTYRTLMTRGQKGCYIYCVDKELNNFIANKVNNLVQNYESKSVSSYIAEDLEVY
ncbi:DUF2075 domain-containing protein [Macrococcus capreoli]|uniref:DUF2075 domain-containing protein n=1 Tax=Macrococcus capreoli TaxID=2982690 RepID=UPI0021D60A91|nr:DUF2075 domain-containing protein [Macrococcus sp. TMW 2.2395]MCU7558432.1 DUF2075 domain-containing protein [Macrococcus sp. TMW 2.2395]